MFTSKLVPVAITGSIVLAGMAVAGGTYLYKKFKKNPDVDPEFEEDIDEYVDDTYDLGNIFERGDHFLEYYHNHESWYNNEGISSIINRPDISSKFEIIGAYEKYLRDNHVDPNEVDSSIETIRRIAIEAPDIFDAHVEYLMGYIIGRNEFDITDILDLDKVCFNTFYNHMSVEKLFNRHMNFILCLTQDQQNDLIYLKNRLKSEYAQTLIRRDSLGEYGETMYNLYYTFEKYLDLFIDNDGLFDPDDYYNAFKVYIDKYVYSIEDTKISHEEVEESADESVEIDEASDADVVETEIIETETPTTNIDQ